MIYYAILIYDIPYYTTMYYTILYDYDYAAALTHVVWRSTVQ